MSKHDLADFVRRIRVGDEQDAADRGGTPNGRCIQLARVLDRVAQEVGLDQ
jgi:hypothetical protein